nr:MULTISPECIES: SDR family NAD(P)-dependent oxidoreductase [Ensifer]
MLVSTSSTRSTDGQDARRLFDANFFGTANTIDALLPRSRRSSTIVNLTSIGGIVGYTGVGYYCATKFAVEGLSDTLRAEDPLGEAFRRKSRHRNGAGTARKVALSGAKE